jgi:hypothetical protein
LPSTPQLIDFRPFLLERATTIETVNSIAFEMSINQTFAFLPRVVSSFVTLNFFFHSNETDENLKGNLGAFFSVSGCLQCQLSIQDKQNNSKVCLWLLPDMAVNVSLILPRLSPKTFKMQ